MKHRSRHRGFVLLITLVMLAMLLIVAAQFARHNASRALEADQIRRNLAMRWGSLSLADSLKDQVAETLETSNTARQAFKLAGADRHWHIRIDNETAKLNLNHWLWRDAAKSNTSRHAVNAYLHQKASGQTLIQARPHVLDERLQRLLKLPPVSSWEQILSEDTEASSSGFQGFRGQNLSQITTLWGEGKLHWRVADADAVEMLCRDIVDHETLQQLMATRQADETLSLSQAMKLLRVPTLHQQAIKQRLTDKAEHYSINIQTRDTWRTDGLFIVLDTTQQPATLIHRTWY